MSLNICKYNGDVIFGKNNIVCRDENLWPGLVESYDKNLSLKKIISSIREEYENYFIYFYLLKEIKYVSSLQSLGRAHFSPETRKFYCDKTIGAYLDKNVENSFDTKIMDTFNPVTETLEVTIVKKMPVQIFVRVIGWDRTITLNDVYLDYKVDKLKEMISVKSGIPIDAVRRLIFEGKQLGDDILVTYGIWKESTIYVMLPLRGGMHDHSSGHNDYNPDKVLNNVQIKYKKNGKISTIMVPWIAEDDSDSFTKKVELLVDNI